MSLVSVHFGRRWQHSFVCTAPCNGDLQVVIGRQGDQLLSNEAGDITRHGALYLLEIPSARRMLCLLHADEQRWKDTRLCQTA